MRGRRDLVVNDKLFYEIVSTLLAVVQFNMPQMLFVIPLMLTVLTKAWAVKATPYDSAVAENFFSCLKYECIHLRHFATRNDAKIVVFHYVEAFYNRIHPYSGIGWLSPVAFEKMLTEGVEDAKMVAWFFVELIGFLVLEFVYWSGKGAV